MSLKAIKRLIERLDSEINEQNLGVPFFSSDDYAARSLDCKYFHPIVDAKSSGKISFIDGGNLEILGAPNFSIQVNRIYFNIFKDNERIHPETLPPKIEFFSVTFATFKEQDIHFDTSIFPVKDDFTRYLPDESYLSFSSWDRSVMNGNMRAGISRVASVARRFSEWEYAKWIIDSELDSSDVIVADGTLQTALTNEYKIMENAYRIAKKKGVIFTGLSKTSQLFTSNGLSLMGALQKFADDCQVTYKTWYYPVASVSNPDHEASIFVTKLNPQAKRVFRYEINQSQADMLDESALNGIFAKLAANSGDISFPGYPYGLINADYEARVRHDELEAFRVRFFSEIAKEEGRWEKFARHVSAVDAHGVLDSLARR
ncbi:MAG: DNA double-strand break repair nuclease NurA [Candidatus Odinarchaeota archaeon]